MDSARQILRFSIPGSIFLLNGMVCYLLYRRLQGVPFVDASAPIRENVAAAIAVVATIPVGFMIYQLYYFTYEPVLRIWPLPWGGRLVRRDRGGQILRTLDQNQLSTLEEVFSCKIDREEIHSVVPGEGSCLQKLMHRTGVLEVDGAAKSFDREKRKLSYENLWYTHWDVLRSTVDIVASQAGNEHVKREYTTLSDIYHSLGAARTAVTSAWGCVVILAFSHPGRMADAPVEAFAGLLLISVLSFGIYSILHVARGQTWRTAAASMTYGLRWFHWRHGQELRKRDS